MHIDGPVAGTDTDDGSDTTEQPAGAVASARRWPTGGADRRTARRVALGSGLACLALMMVGVRRTFDLDSSMAVGKFVVTPSLRDPFRITYLLTNHPLFSFLEHVVYSVTGSHSGPVMRALPMGVSAVTAGLVGWLLARRWGRGPAIAGVAVLITNPMVADEGSRVRGYSMLLLATVITSTLLLRWIRTGRATTWSRIAYGVVAGAGIATHLYMLVVLAVHAVVVAAVVARNVWRARWASAGERPAAEGSTSSQPAAGAPDDAAVSRAALGVVTPALGALALGGIAYLWLVHDMWFVIQYVGRRFDAGFPRDLAVAFGGGTVVAALLTAALVGPQLWIRRRDVVAVAGCAAIVASVLVAWLARPYWIYPRFFLWAFPLVAVGVASAVAGRRGRVGRLVIPAVVVLVALQVVTLTPRLVRNRYATPALARVAREARAQGGVACLLTPATELPLDGYVNDLPLAVRGHLSDCDVAVAVATGITPGLDTLVRKDLPYRVRYGHVGEPGFVYSDRPLRCWQDPGAAGTAACRGR